MIARALAFLIGAVLAASAAEAACQDKDFGGQSYVVCEAVAGEDLRLFLKDAQGLPYGSFQRIDAALESEGRKLVFAMNAGMYHPDRSPVGLYLENGVASGPLVTKAGPGNFGMQPNGIFCIGAEDFAVIETLTYAKAPRDCRYATQSGPMLVIAGALHPRFLPDSTSRYTRNGVGVSADGKRAVFVISKGRVTFHEFARFFRDGLDLPDALYFDGNISRLHAPGLGRSDFGFPMGPVVGLTAPAG